MPNHDILRAAYLRAKAVEYLWTWVGTPYIFGGDDFSSFDCSGLMVEILQAVGLIPHGSDFSAAGLYDKFETGAVERGYAGCLIFWYSGVKIVHVEMMIDSSHSMGASGGGSLTTTIADAIKSNAFVKMRPIGYRNQTFVILDPFLGAV